MDDWRILLTGGGIIGGAIVHIASSILKPTLTDIGNDLKPTLKRGLQAVFSRQSAATLFVFANYASLACATWAALRGHYLLAILSLAVASLGFFLTLAWVAASATERLRSTIVGNERRIADLEHRIAMRPVAPKMETTPPA